MDYELIIKNIILPIVEDKEAIMLKTVSSENENEVTVLILGRPNDIAHLIGKGGSVANSIREAASVASKIEGKRLYVKFESYED